MKYFILAGEASGDKQAGLLCQAIRQYDPQSDIQGWGGDDMTTQGVKVTKHYRELAFMGFVEVIKHLPEIIRNFKKCKKEILDFKPDALILVDYPGFNLRMASWAHAQGLKVYYYISPQLWAWHTSRVHKIKKAVRKMFVILPFEKDFYKKFGMDVTYIGHPLAIDMHKQVGGELRKMKNQIGLLPGSRKHEVERLLPEMVKLAARFPQYNFVVAAVPHLSKELYDSMIRGQSNVLIEVGNMKKVLGESEIAIVTSGTATLETALMDVPQIVVYKGSPVSYQIAKRLIKVPFISLVNLIIGQKLVTELIQSACNADNLAVALHELEKPEVRKKVLDGYRFIRESLFAGGGAESAAKEIISDLLHSKS